MNIHESNTFSLDLKNKNEQHENDDFVFRFLLSPKDYNMNPDDTLRIFFQNQIRDLLKIVSFAKDGMKILPNEFIFLNNPNKAYPIFEDD